MPTASERIVWGQGGPEDTRLVSTTLSTGPNDPALPVNISAVICWENYMPLFRQHIYNQGSQIYCAPTVDARDSFTTTMQHIATEGRVFVLSANQMS